MKKTLKILGIAGAAALLAVVAVIIVIPLHKTSAQVGSSITISAQAQQTTWNNQSTAIPIYLQALTVAVVPLNVSATVGTVTNVSQVPNTYNYTAQYNPNPNYSGPVVITAVQNNGAETGTLTLNMTYPPPPFYLFSYTTSSEVNIAPVIIYGFNAPSASNTLTATDGTISNYRWFGGSQNAFEVQFNPDPTFVGSVVITANGSPTVTETLNMINPQPVPDISVGNDTQTVTMIYGEKGGAWPVSEDFRYTVCWDGSRGGQACMTTPWASDAIESSTSSGGDWTNWFWPGYKDALGGGSHVYVSSVEQRALPAGVSAIVPNLNLELEEDNGANLVGTQLDPGCNLFVGRYYWDNGLADVVGRAYVDQGPNTPDFHVEGIAYAPSGDNGCNGQSQTPDVMRFFIGGIFVEAPTSTTTASSTGGTLVAPFGAQYVSDNIPRTFTPSESTSTGTDGNPLEITVESTGQSWFDPTVEGVNETQTTVIGESGTCSGSPTGLYDCPDITAPQGSQCTVNLNNWDYLWTLQHMSGSFGVGSNPAPYSPVPSTATCTVGPQGCSVAGQGCSNPTTCVTPSQSPYCSGSNYQSDSAGDSCGSSQSACEGAAGYCTVSGVGSNGDSCDGQDGAECSTPVSEGGCGGTYISGTGCGGTWITPPLGCGGTWGPQYVLSGGAAPGLGVASGSTATFPIGSLTAPAAMGTYTDFWQMQGFPDTYPGDHFGDVMPFTFTVGPASTSSTSTPTLYSCGGGVCATSTVGSASCALACPPPATPVVTCTPSSIFVGSTSQCGLTLDGVTQTNTTWTVSGTAGGLIDGTGLYSPSTSGLEVAQGTLPDDTFATSSITVTTAGNVTVLSENASNASIPVPASWDLSGNVNSGFVCLGVSGNLSWRSTPCSGTSQSYSGVPADFDGYTIINESTSIGHYSFQSISGGPTHTLTPSSPNTTFTIFWNPIADIQVSPTSASLNPSTAPNQAVTITNTGAPASSLLWTATTSTTSGGNWLVVSSPGGTIANGASSGATGAVTISFDPSVESGLPIGTYRGTVAIAGKDLLSGTSVGSKTIPVTLVVTGSVGTFYSCGAGVCATSTVGSASCALACPPPAIPVATCAPSSISVPGTSQCDLKINGVKQTNTTWAVSGTAGGSIDSTGLYGSSVTSGFEVATGMLPDGTFATSSITVTPSGGTFYSCGAGVCATSTVGSASCALACPPPAIPVATCAPSSISVPGTSQCDLKINGVKQTNTTWAVSGTAGGSIDSTGLYGSSVTSGFEVATGALPDGTFATSSITVTPVGGSVTVLSENANNTSIPVPASWDLSGNVTNTIPGFVCLGVSGNLSWVTTPCLGTHQSYSGLPTDFESYSILDASASISHYTFRSIEATPIAEKRSGDFLEALGLSLNNFFSTPAEAYIIPQGYSQTLTPSSPSATFTILWTPTADMQLSTTSASLNPSTMPNQTVKITNTGAPGSTLNWTANTSTTSGGNWLVISSSGGTIANGASSGATGAETISFDPSVVSGLPNGTYNGTVTVKGYDGATPLFPVPTISVTLTISGTPPATPVVTCAPPSISVGDTSQCVLKLDGVTQTNATWTSSGSAGGVIGATGIYNPTSGGTETITGTLPDGSSSNATVIVTSLPACGGLASCQAACSPLLTANPSSIIVPESSNLSYSCTNVTQCELSGGQFGGGTSEPASTTLPVSPSVTTLYTLTCVNQNYSDSSATSSATVTVNGSNRCEQNPKGAGCQGQ